MCPFDRNCREKSIIYECSVNTADENEAKIYKGATEGEAKKRVATHGTSFNDESYRNNSELSKYIWKQKEENKEYQMKWKIICKAHPYKNGSKYIYYKSLMPMKVPGM